MSDFESKIDITIDAGQALAAIKTLQRQISDFHTSLAKGSATANIKSLQMQQTLIDTINATGQYSAQMKTVASATQTFTTALEKNKLSMGQYFKYAGGASKSFGRFFKSEMDTIQKVAVERVKDLQTQYIKMGRDANGAIRSIAVRPLALDMENLATRTQIAAQKQQLLNQLLKQGSTNLLNFGKNTQWAGRQLMVGFTIPLGILGATAAKTFMQMEEQAIKFKRVYGDTFTATKETDAMLKQVQDLASEFTKYGVTVEKTMEQAAKAAATGKMGADLLAQVSEATRLSVLGNVEQEQALETTISLTNAFGTAADKLREKINFLNAVENQTVTSIEDLTIAIPKAAPVIKQLGGGVEDLTFFLTAMREGGINASEGANALKSGLASLINPTDKASKFLQGFGINIKSIVEANKGDVKGLVVDFAQALDTLDPLNRARAIEQLFGKFQFSRLSTLFQNVIKDGSQAARVLELTKQSSAELGILAQRELNRISASPMYKFQKAIADFKKELAPVGEEFLKAVTPIIQFGTDILKAFNNLDGGVKQFIVNATGLIAGIGPVFLMTFGLLANGVANIIKGFTFVKTVFNKASSASMVLGETTDYMTQQQLEAAAVAASLEQVHNKLTQAFTVETTAVKNLASAYQKAVSAQNAFTGPPATGKPRAPKKYADGIFSVPGPKGAGDIVPAMLAPGEAVIPAKPAQKYRGFIKGMIAGKIPGFELGRVGDENLDWDSLSDREIKDLVKNVRSAPDSFKKEKYAMGWTTRDAEVEYIKSKLREIGASQAAIDRYSSIHVSHLMPSKINRNIGGRNVSISDFTDVENMTPDVGLINQFTEQAKNAKISVKDLEPVIGKSLTKSQIQEQLDKLSRGEHIGATPAGNRVLNAIAQQGAAGVIGLGPATKAVAPIVAGVTGMRAADRTSGGFLKGIGNRKFSQKAVEQGKKQTESLLKTIYNRAKKMLTDPEYRAEQKANKKASVAQTSAAKEKTKAANAEKKAAVAKGSKAKAEKKAADKSRAKTQSKTAATPTLSVKEELGNGVSRTVGTNKAGKDFEQFHVVDENGKKRRISATEAQQILSNRGAAASPKGRLKGILTGLPGKLGIAGLATMGAGAVTGNQQVSSLADQLFTAAMLSSFVPQGTMGKMKDKLGLTKDKFMQSSLGQRYAGSRMYSKFGEATKGLSEFKVGAKAEVASKGLMKALPFLAKGATMVGMRFLNMIPIVGQVALALEIIYNVATINAKAQEEISKAVVETLTMTKEKLDGLNEFFGSDAKLSGIRTLSVTGAGQSGEQATLAEQFRQSEQFKNTYKEQAGKLKGASKEQFAITMQALGVDLYGQGMSEEQVQIIIDAIKKEAGQQEVVIKFKDLRLDTETGRKNLAQSLNSIADGAIKEFDSNRDWFGLNWEAQAKLDEFESQISGFVSGLSQEFESGRVSASQFESSFGDIESAFNKAEAANPGDGLQFLNSVLMNVSPEVAQASAGISDMSTKLLVLKLAAEGAAMSTQLLADAATGDANALDYLNYLDRFEKNKNRKLREQQKVVSGISQQQQNLQKEEKGINDIYDKRIKALERINQLQEQMSKQKQNQLDLADALSRGDVFAAAQAMQKIRADQAALALEQQKNALEDEKAKKVGAVQDKADSLDGALSSAKAKISDISNEKPKDYDSKINAQTIEQMFKGVPGKLWSILNWQTYFADEQTKFKEFSKYISGDAGARGNISGSLGILGGLGGSLNPAGTLLKAGLGVAGTVAGSGKKEKKKADGGYISGPGSGTSDSIPARLSNGEYVVRAKAVEALGTNFLDKVNHAEKFADGGYASSDERRSSLKPKAKSKGLIGNAISAFAAVTSKMGMNPFDLWNPLDPTGGMAQGRFVKDVLFNNVPKLLSGSGGWGDAGMTALAGLSLVPGGDKVTKISKVAGAASKVASAVQRNAVFLADNTAIDSTRFAKLLETSMRNPDVFTNPSSVKMPSEKASIFPAAIDAFGELGLGKFGTRSVSSVEEFAQNLTEMLPQRIAQTEASIMLMQEVAKGARITDPAMINTMLVRSGKLSAWQRAGFRPEYAINDLARFSSGDTSVLEQAIKQLDQLRNTAHLLPDVAFRAGTEPYEAFVKTIQNISSSFDTSKFLQQGVPFQSIVQKAFKPALTNPVMAKILGSSNAQALTFFEHIFSGMGAKGIKPVGLEGKMYTDPLEQFFVSGRLFTKEGEDAGGFARGFYDNSVYHKVLALDEKFQGKGFGTDFSAMSEELYRLLGLNEIRLTAGLTKGPYTWAKAGYQWGSSPSNVIARIQGMLARGGRTAQETKILEDLAKRFEMPFGSKGYPTPKEISDISVLNQEGTTLGKEIFHEFAGYDAVKFIKDIPLNKEISQKMYSILEQASKLSGIDILDIIPKFKNGGMFRTSYAQGGLAMLHDKEFVMNAGAVKEYGLSNLKAMNNGTYNSGSVYNSYGVNINVGGSNSNSSDIARTVIREIKRLDSQNIRSTKV